MNDSINWVAWIILFFLVADFLLHQIADQLNLASITKKIPETFQGIYDPDRYRQSQKYIATCTRFEQITATVDLLVLFGFWFGGGFALMDNWTRSLNWSPLVTGLVYIFGLAGLKAMIDQPFSIYSTFVIEQRYGFNRTTWWIWVKDRLTGIFLVVLLGVPLLTGVLAFFQYTGVNAWIWCWIMITAFSILVQFIAPTWIMPLFNRFEPIEEGELKSAILAYARSIDFPLENVYVMDGSKRSSKSNAFFTGFGRHRRIVLYDTLVDQHTTEALVAVLAHEMGHYKMKHILKMMALGVAQTGVMLYLMSLVIHSPTLFEAFFLEQPSIHAGLVFFGLLYAPVDFFLGLIVQAISRRHEFAADQFAAATTGKSRPMVEALKKLSVQNLSNLSPHPLTVFLNYSHPPVCVRIAALEKTQRQLKK